MASGRKYKGTGFYNILQKENLILKQVLKTEEWKIPNLISENQKTGFSHNQPRRTCFSGVTKLCAKYCYGNRNHFTFEHVIRKTIKNFLFVSRTNINDVVKSFQYQLPLVRDFRWLGIGELFPKLTETISKVVPLRDDLNHYIYSRNLEECLKLDDSLGKRIKINFSIDRSTPIKTLIEASKNKNLFISYVQTLEHESINPIVKNRIDIIHPLNKNKKITSTIQDRKKICDFSIDKSIKCSACRKCIDPFEV